MSRNKREVDNYVEQLYRHGGSDKEKALKFPNVARQYMACGEFLMAKRYLTVFIENHKNSPGIADAYKLMGDILVELQDNESALAYYKMSHEVAPSRSTINRVCSLLQNGYGLTEGVESRKMWFTLQKAASAASVAEEKNSPENQLRLIGRLGQSPLASFRRPTPIHSPFTSAGDVNGKFGRSEISKEGSRSDSTFLNNEVLLKQFEKQFDDCIVKVKDEVVRTNKEQFEKLHTALLKSFITSVDNFQYEVKLCRDEVKELKLSITKQFTSIKETMETSGKHFMDLKLQCCNLEAQVKSLAGEAKLESKKSEPKEHSVIPKVTGTASNKSKTKDTDPISEVFKMLEGSWECVGCRMINKKESLTCPSCLTSQPGKQVEPPKKTETNSFPSTTQFTFGLKPPSSGSIAFGDLANANTSKPGVFSFGSSTSSTLFSSPIKPIFGQSPFSGKPLFATTKPPTEQVKSTVVQDDDDAAEEFVPTAEFKPVIALPALSDSKRGDENENVIYEIRAKLYRFDGANDWKERGIGNIKILQDKENQNKIRIVMWREQIHKLACNHYVTKDFKLESVQSDKMLKWAVQDFAEGEARSEIFLCKFYKPEQREEFENNIHRFVSELNRVTESETAKVLENLKLTSDMTIESIPKEVLSKPIFGQQPTKTQQETNSFISFSEICKKPEGSWECSGCYLINAKEALVCPSCSTHQPGKEDVLDKQIEPSIATTNNPPPFTFGFKTSPADSLGFGGLAKQNESKATAGFAFSFGSSSSTLFSTPIKPMFGQPASIFSPKAAEVVSKPFADTTQSPFMILDSPPQHQDDVVDDFIPTAEFQPVIPLPALVQTKRGDENDNLIYEIRAKIYRLDTTIGEGDWKERGVGSIKILQDKDNKSKIRIIMWREQIYKLACNHYVKKEFRFEPVQSDKMLKWAVQDYADGEPRAEIFLCKFARPDQCNEFEQHIKTLVSYLESLPESDAKEAKNYTQLEISAANAVEVLKPTVDLRSTDKQNLEEPVISFAELCKKPEGSWECSGCYMINTKDSLTCPSCLTKQPGLEIEPSKMTEPSSSTPISPPKFSFGFNTSSVIGFGDLATGGNLKSGFAFGSPSSSLFSKPIKPIFGDVGSTKTTLDIDTPGHDDGDKVDEFEPTAEFKPVIPLPALVNTIRGDENDNILHEIRARLYRFDTSAGSGEWKERGSGNIKILQDKDNPDKIRIVMWREQIHKLACNHYLKKDFTFEPVQSDKMLKWVAQDYADQECRSEIFLCKFARPEQRDAFKAVVDNLITELESVSTNALTITVSDPVSNTENNQAAPATDGASCKLKENSARAKETGEHNETSCPGCIGCDPDKFDFGKLEGRTVPTYQEQSMGPSQFAKLLEQPDTKDGMIDLSPFFKVTLSEGTPTTNTPFTSSGSSLFGATGTGGSIFSTGITSTPNFRGFSFLNSPSQATTSSEPLFGDTSTPSTSSAPTMFGGSVNPPAFTFGNAFNFKLPPNTSLPDPLEHEVEYHDDEDSHEQEYKDEDPDYEGVYEEDDEELVFDHEGSIRVRNKLGVFEDYGKGRVLMSYDSDLFCMRLAFLTDSEKYELDHTICADTELHVVDDKTAKWSGLIESSDDGTFDRMDLEVTFDDENIFNDFRDRWSDSREIASQANVTEAYLLEVEDPTK